jgi:hypothetical protein
VFSHRSTIAIGNAFIDYTVFIPRIRTRIAIAAHAHRSRNLKRFHRLYSVHSHRSVIAASHTHRSRNWKLSFKQCLKNTFGPWRQRRTKVTSPTDSATATLY